MYYSLLVFLFYCLVSCTAEIPKTPIRVDPNAALNQFLTLEKYGISFNEKRKELGIFPIDTTFLETAYVYSGCPSEKCLEWTSKLIELEEMPSYAY